MKGFRPGREPAHLKKRRALARLGKDATWLQKQTVEAVVGRSPREVRKMVRRWTVGVLTGALVLGGSGAFLYRWSAVAGVVVHVLTLALLVLGYRLWKQGPRLEEMARGFR
ncbi:MAG TPA: hypothetical protein VE173_13800 [Longimicrobiales bacterium]|jgi:hypothetical protein|nr:hypothetical protein [Longimicrobiales bacterium]